MEIFLGPGGIPIQSRGKGTSEGVRCVADIGLNAMEIEFVRSVNLSNEQSKIVGEVAKECGVALSIHAPYYINLNSADPKIVAASKKRILDSAERGEAMGAEAVAVHAAYYGESTPEQTYEKVKEEFLDVIDNMKISGIKNVKIGVETMAKKGQFGTLEETIKLSKEVKSVVPYVDWSHLFARNNGEIDYAKVLDDLEKLKMRKIHSHFQGLEKNKQGNFVDIHAPLGKGPQFEPLVKEIMKRKVDITIIAESPILEQDSLKMKKIFEKSGYSFKKFTMTK